MIKVLFDTTAVSHWHGDTPEYRLPLEQTIRELTPRKPVLFVSSVTVQELAVLGLLVDQWAAIDSFLKGHFTALAFDDGSAVAAARAQAAVGRPARTKPKSADRFAKELWFRDAAILGTAVEHGMDMVVTMDAGIRRMQGSYAGEIRILEAAAPPAG